VFLSVFLLQLIDLPNTWNSNFLIFICYEDKIIAISNNKNIMAMGDFNGSIYAIDIL
jgi:hypothetical protein